MILVVLVMLGSALNVSAAPAKTYVLKLAYAASDKTITGDTSVAIKKGLEEGSAGRIKVEIYPNAQLGGDRELLEGCQAGDISMVIQATAPQVSFIPQVAIFDMPATLTDPWVTLKMLNDTAFRKKMNTYYEKAGLKLVQIVPSAHREMSSNLPVYKMEDFKGIKIRTMENPYHMAYWKALGANPTPLSFSELYIALQQNLVQAQENPIEVLTASKLGEVQKYVILTHHILFINTAVMNKSLYDGMPADLKKLVDKVLYETGVQSVDAALKKVVDVTATLKGQGKEIIQPSADMYARMKEAAKPVYEMIASKVGKDLVDLMLKDYAAASKK
jgi:tripartite ATP-independent transporter DctP family solute receptor